jgi:hypothetical protein
MAIKPGELQLGGGLCGVESSIKAQTNGGEQDECCASQHNGGCAQYNDYNNFEDNHAGRSTV